MYFTLFSSVDCNNSYIGLSTRQLKKTAKEHIPACIDKFLKLAEKEKKSNKIMNAIKRSAIAEHLVKSPGFAENFSSERSI